jgi:hypothetical protein
VTEPDAWRSGKGLVKLALIDESIALQRFDNGRVDMMLKKEVTSVQFSEPAFPKKARAIQFNITLRTAYEFGNEQFNLGHALASATSDWIEHGGVRFLLRYTAEMNPVEIAEFATEAEARRSHGYSFIDERDGKNWDANVQTPHRQALVEWYGQINPQLRRVAEEGIKVHGAYRKGKVKITYTVDGTVKSGHFDTSSGNAALNIDVTAQAIVSLPAALRPVEVRGLVMGDDLLLWLYFDHEVSPTEYCAAINAAEQALGIHPVRGIFKDVRNVSFCSMTFYERKNGALAIMPKMGRQFAKLFWTINPLNQRNPQRLASTIAHAFHPTYHTFPPMRLFLEHHMGVAPIECRVDEWTRALPWVLRQHELPKYDDVNWVSGNEVKYGMIDGTLDFMADALAAVGPAGAIRSHAVDLMLKEDLSDPADRRGVLAC